MSKRYRGSKREVNVAVIVLAVIVVAIIAIISYGNYCNYERTHFAEGTKINEQDCSGLTVSEVRSGLEGQQVTLLFENTEYQINGSMMGRSIGNTKELEEFLYTQKSVDRGARDFMLSSESYSINERVLIRSLEGMNEFSRVVPPKDAYIIWDKEGIIEVVPEVYGQGINLEEACKLAEQELMNGRNTIDFRKLMQIEPKVKAEDLTPGIQYINNILQTSITFGLKDGSTYTLDFDIIKEWVYHDGLTDAYEIKLEEGITEFVTLLSEKVRRLGYYMTYVTPSGESIKLPVQWGSYDTLDVEAEVQEIWNKMQIGGTHELKPIYSKINDMSEFEDYVLLSIEEQRLRIYENGTEICNYPVVTGMAKVNDTPKGVFYSNWKTRNYYLSRYGVKVAYWVTVDGNVGIHDANWRTADEFVPDRYLWNGSHGCINMKKEDAAFVYEHITESMPIIIY